MLRKILKLGLCDILPDHWVLSIFQLFELLILTSLLEELISYLKNRVVALRVHHSRLLSGFVRAVCVKHARRNVEVPRVHFYRRILFTREVALKITNLRLCVDVPERHLMEPLVGVFRNVFQSFVYWLICPENAILKRLLHLIEQLLFGFKIILVFYGLLSI